MPQFHKAELLRQLLVDRDIPCPVCGYNLRGAVSNKCPECGSAIDLRVASSDLRYAPWLVSILAITLPLGFTTVMGGILGILFWRYPRGAVGPHQDSQILITVIAPIVLGASLWVLITRRRRIWRKSVKSQAILAIIIVLGSAVVLGLHLMIMFKG